MSKAVKTGITPFLWFDGDVEEAANFYAQVFKDARVESVLRPAPGGPAQSATVTLREPNPAKAQAAVQAMPQMGKLDIARLQEASARA